MIIDAHAHIATWPTLKESEKMILVSMEKYAIGFSIISDCDCSEFPSLDKPSHSVNSLLGLRHVISFVKKDPSRLGAAFWIRPVKEKVTPEMKEYIKKNREYIYALKFHPFESQMKISDKRLLPYLELAREFSLPILVHTAKDEFSDIKMLANLANDNKDLNFIAAHLQLCSDNTDGLLALKKADNLYADTAWVPMKMAKKVLLTIGDNRIMFGSDNPIDGYDTLGNPMYEDYFHNKCKLPGRLYHNLMYRNAMEVYKIHIKI